MRSRIGGSFSFTHDNFLGLNPRFSLMKKNIMTKDHIFLDCFYIWRSISFKETILLLTKIMLESTKILKDLDDIEPDRTACLRPAPGLAPRGGGCHQPGLLSWPAGGQTGPSPDQEERALSDGSRQREAGCRDRDKSRIPSGKLHQLTRDLTRMNERTT